jgi:hypothetical protein
MTGHTSTSVFTFAISAEDANWMLRFCSAGTTVLLTDQMEFSREVNLIQMMRMLQERLSVEDAFLISQELHDLAETMYEQKRCAGETIRRPVNPAPLNRSWVHPGY